MSAQIIDAKGIFEARNIQINAQRVADKILERQKFHSELEKRIKAGDWREPKK